VSACTERLWGCGGSLLASLAVHGRQSTGVQACDEEGSMYGNIRYRIVLKAGRRASVQAQWPGNRRAPPRACASGLPPTQKPSPLQLAHNHSTGTVLLLLLLLFVKFRNLPANTSPVQNANLGPNEGPPQKVHGVSINCPRCGS